MGMTETVTRRPAVEDDALPTLHMLFAVTANGRLPKLLPFNGILHRQEGVAREGDSSIYISTR